MRSQVIVDEETGYQTFVCRRGHDVLDPSCVGGCGRLATRMCDGLAGPLAFGEDPQTCDAWLCVACARHDPRNKTDLCPSCVMAGR